MSRLLGYVLGAALGLGWVSANACVHKAGPSRSRVIHGTCESTCERYQSCKGVDDPRLYEGCIEDCRLIYSEDGQMDTRALRQLESMDCPELLAFIDGPERPASTSTSE